MDVYRVGGAVRDRLLGRAIKDADYVVVGASPDELLKKGFKSVGKDFPVFLHPQTHEEYALARTERKQGPGYTGFSFYAAPDVSLEADLKRRDLTINAIAENSDGTLIDPYGGYSDLQQKVLRHVSPAFVEDPVRILRVARFMARFAYLGFYVAPETLALMQQMVHNGEVDALVPERIWREFSTALTESTPTAFIQTLRVCQALNRICPELDQLFSQPAHQSTACNITQGDVALQALDYAASLTENPIIRFAVLMQYMAQGEHGTQSIETVVKRWRLPTVYRDVLMLTVQYRSNVHQAAQLTPAELLDMIERMDGLRRLDRFKDVLTVCEVDWCVNPEHEQPYSQRDRLLIACELIRQVAVKPLVDLGYQGQLLKQQLSLKRIKALEASVLFQ